MPPLIGAAIVGAFAFIGGATLAGALAIGVLQLAFTLGAQFLGGGQKARAPSVPDFQVEARERRVTARNDASPRALVFGEVRKSGTLMLFESTGPDNEFLHVGVVLADHKCDGFLDFQINDEVITDTIDSAGNVLFGRFQDHARLIGHTGSLSQDASANWLAEIPGYTAAERGRGQTYIEARFKWKRSIWPNSFKNVSATLRGILLFDPRDAAISIAEVFTGTPGIFRTAASHALAAGDLVWVIGHKGGDPAITKEYQVGTIVSADRLTLLGDDGLPLTVTTAGAGGTMTKMVWSDNWALCMRRWLTHRDGFNIADEEIDDAQTSAAANVCDEQVAITPEGITFAAAASDNIFVLEGLGAWRTGDLVTLDGASLPGGFAVLTDYFLDRLDTKRYRLATSLENARAGITVSVTSNGDGTITRDSQLRYTCNGVVQLGQAPIEVLDDLKTGGSGQVVNQAGIFRIFAGAAVAQSGSADETDMRTAEFSGVPRLPREQLFNAASGLIIDPDQFYAQIDVPLVKNDTYAAQDGGERIVRPFDLPFTHDPIAAQRLLKIEIEKSRQALVLNFPAKPRKFNTAIWDVEAVSLDRLGFVAKPFQVTQAKLNADWSVDLNYREYADAVFDFAAGEETKIDLAPNTNLPSPFAIAAPTDLTLESGDATLDVRQDGTVFSRIKAVWTAPADIFVQQGGRIEIQYKKSSDPDSSFQPASPVPGDATFQFILDVLDGVAYDVRVRSVNSLGVESDWVTFNGHIVEGKGAKPAPPDQFFVDQLADGTRRYTVIDAAPPADVRVGGGYRIKYKEGGGATENDWPTLPSLTEQLLRTFPFENNELAAGNYSFLARSVDSSGNESATSLFAEVTLGNPRLATSLVERTERGLGWPGVLVDAFIGSDTIFAQSSSVIDDLGATIDGLPATINAIGTNKSPITYTTLEIDVGVDLNFRPLVSVQAQGTSTVTMQTGTDADGEATGAFVAVGPVSAKRYIRIRVSIADTAPRIDNLNIILDAPSKVEVFENIAVGSATDIWFNRIAAGHFEVGSLGGLAVISQASLTAIQNVGAGYSSELISKTKTVNGQPAAEFKVYDNTNTLADATVDVLLRGPKKE